MMRKIISLLIICSFFISIMCTVVNAKTITSAEVEEAIKWATDKKDANVTSYSGWCLKFVADAWWSVDVSNSGYSNATLAGNAMITNTDQNPPRGAAVFWYWTDPDDGVNYGHVGISLGNGQVIHADYNGIKITGLYLDSARTYRGWGIWGNHTMLAEPSKPSLTFDKASNPIYKIPKSKDMADIKFSWGATDNTLSYDLELYNWNSEFLDKLEGIHDTLEAYRSLPVGNYSAVLYAKNSLTKTGSNWVTFQVVEEPQIHTDKDRYLVGETIKVEWLQLNYAQAYDLYIYDWNVPANLKKEVTGINNRYDWPFTLPVGNYSAVLYPKNQWGNVESNWVSFQVLESATVTFNSQGGSTVESNTTNYDTTITEPIKPTKQGFVFGGWYKESTCTNIWNFSTDKVTADTTLYASWIAENDLWNVSLEKINDTTINVKVINRLNDYSKLPLLLVSFYKDKKFLSVKQKAIENGIIDYTFEIQASSGANSVKAFLWKSINCLEPVSTSTEIIIN